MSWMKFDKILAAVSNLNLAPGASYFESVRCHDNAGLTTLETPGVLFCDSSTPETILVSAGFNGLYRDFGFWSNSTDLAFAFHFDEHQVPHCQSLCFAVDNSLWRGIRAWHYHLEWFRCTKWQRLLNGRSRTTSRDALLTLGPNDLMSEDPNYHMQLDFVFASWPAPSNNEIEIVSCDVYIQMPSNRIHVSNIPIDSVGFCSFGPWFEFGHSYSLVLSCSDAKGLIAESSSASFIVPFAPSIGPMMHGEHCSSVAFVQDTSSIQACWPEIRLKGQTYNQVWGVFTVSLGWRIYWRVKVLHTSSESRLQDSV